MKLFSLISYQVQSIYWLAFIVLWYLMGSYSIASLNIYWNCYFVGYAVYLVLFSSFIACLYWGDLAGNTDNCLFNIVFFHIYIIIYKLYHNL